MALSELASKTLSEIYNEQLSQPLSFVDSPSIQKKTGLTWEQINGACKYLEQKGILRVEWTSSDFFAELTALGIEYAESAELVDKATVSKNFEVRNKILGALYGLYHESPDQYSSKEILIQTLGYEPKQIEFNIKYLGGYGLVEIEWFLGGGFIARITASGIDAIEQKGIPEEKLQKLDTTTMTIRPMFPIVEPKIEPDLVFILMPFDKEFDAIYKDCITKAVCEKHLRCLRADEIFSNKPIMEDIWKYINQARLVIADLTGRNPNVLYEVGICHTVGKDVIFMTQSIRDVPFDIRHLRVITYVNTPEGLEESRGKLEKTIDSVINPQV